MSRWVIVADRIPVDISIPVPSLRTLRGRGHDAVGLSEASQRGIIPARIVIHQAETFRRGRGRVVHVGVLSRKRVLCGQGAERVVRFALAKHPEAERVKLVGQGSQTTEVRPS